MQFSRNIVQKNENSMQKEVINQAFWLINEQTKSDYSINCEPWMAQIFVQLCDTRALFQLDHLEIFHDMFKK